MWNWGIWGALIVATVAGIAALVLLARRVRVVWQDLKDLRRDMVHRLDELTRRAEVTAEKVAAAGETAELDESLGRLRISLAQLTVLRNALAEVEYGVDRVAAYVPRK